MSVRSKPKFRCSSLFDVGQNFGISFLKKPTYTYFQNTWLKPAKVVKTVTIKMPQALK